MTIAKNHFIAVADFHFDVTSNENIAIVLDDGFDLFRITAVDSIDCTITCFNGLNQALIPNEKPIYTAKTEDAILWEIYSDGDGILLTVYNPENTAELQQIARYNEAKKTLEVYSTATELNGESVIEPLKYPLLPLLLYYIALANDALMIHASGVFDGEKGRIFSGFSGVGKSTMAKIWYDTGSTVINDDRLIIRKIENEFWVYNTPMYYRDYSKKAPLNHVYLPFHNSENTIEKLTGVRAIASLMAFCIQHGYSANNTQKLLDLTGELTKKCSVYRLGVVPTPAIIDFIKSNES